MSEMSDSSPTPTSEAVGSVQEEPSAASPNQSRLLPPTPPALSRQAKPPTKPRGEEGLSTQSTKGSPRQKIAPTTEPMNPVDQVLAQDQPFLPSPMEPSKCPLFCCFYAEFDNVVGPKVCFQCPRHFMDQDIGIPTERVHKILADTFNDIQPSQKENTDSSIPKTQSTSNHQGDLETQIPSSNENNTKDKEPPTKSLQPNEVSSSIFDSTSEYIITGNELAGKMICLSTHHFHILTRPTVITNKRYERNALLFCVGFVLRRAEDPRPFRPLLSKWAVVLRSMEVESQFLTKPTLRPKVQPMLERLLVSLNSLRRECNLLLDSANSLNLKLFRAPKPPALPVPDHKVPVLLRKDWQFHMYDWDLAINWVVMHIDGAKHAKRISTITEVDMEMVRACLRVLKHHEVIALVDMFFYSNRYECTDRAAAMLAGKEPRLLQDAFDFVVKHHNLEYQSSHGGLSDSNHSAGILNPTSSSNHERPFSPNQTFSTSFPPLASSIPGSVRGSSPKVGSVAASHEVHANGTLRREQKKMKAALAELYCSCNRKVSFGELWIAKTTELKPTAPVSVKNGDGGAVLEDANGSHLTSTAKSLDGRAGRSLPDDEGLWSSSNRRKATGLDPMSPHEANQSFQRAGDLKGTIDWKEVFQYFDHRRFAIFGIVHGLLRRVHNYPLVYDMGGTTNNDTQNSAVPQGFERRSQNSHATFGNESVKKSSKVSLQDRRGSSTGSRTKRESNEDLTDLVSQLVLSMDGITCDDELVCMFEKPLEKLLDLVKTVGNKGVVSIYSTEQD